MSQELILANARLILPNEIITGSLCVRDGVIADISSGAHMPKSAIDVQADFVAPGLIELHTDNLERHLMPRPKINWPHRAAIIAHDREMAGAGITTVFDAIRVGSRPSLNRRPKHARQIVDEIAVLRNADALRISHQIHLRAELCSEMLQDELDEFGPEDRIGIVSMMDHTPGQRQFKDLARYKTFACGKHGLEESKFDAHVAFLQELQITNATAHETATVAAARRFGATLASHDDTTVAQVANSHANGVTLAEFPTTLEAAEACHAVGIATILGAPNIVRGASHSGNVAAVDLAQASRLDILSSDYVPASLLMAAVQIGAVWSDLPRGIATVTANPARKVGLEDRGRLETGLRGDVIRFALIEGTPVLKGTWYSGTLVA